MSRKTALITGGSGYFGIALRDHLFQAGHAVRIFDLNDSDDRPAAVEIHRGDIRDAQAISAACRGVDLVFHCVAQVPLAKDRHLFESVNTGGTENVLRAAQAAGVAKVIYVSSSAVFGVPKQNPVTEDIDPAPAEAYGRAKHEGENRCREFARRGLDVSIIRPRTILGHGRLGLFQVLFEWVREGANVPVLGRGDNLYQFVHADDLAAASMLASARPGPGVYHCGAAEFGTMRETLEALCAHAKTGSRVKSVPMRPAVWGMQLTSALGLSPLGAYHALMYGRSLYFDISKARRELGWQPRYSNVEMLIQSYDWYLRNRAAVMTGSSASPHRSAVKQGALKLVKWLL